nr:MAG TPA: hypothetical protein [Caudoviricetes sp.]DAQ45142.1 MAG TPA: hypothetical protein [Caudoviricetes sp.]
MSEASSPGCSAGASVTTTCCPSFRRPSTC